MHLRRDTMSKDATQLAARQKLPPNARPTDWPTKVGLGLAATAVLGFSMEIIPTVFAAIVRLAIAIK